MHKTLQHRLILYGSIGVPPQPTTTIQTDGTTSLVEIGNNYFLNTVGVSNTGPQLRSEERRVGKEWSGPWAPIDAIKTANGYDVAWKDWAKGALTVWSTDSAGNYTGNIVPVVPGNSMTL